MLRIVNSVAVGRLVLVSDESLISAGKRVIHADKVHKMTYCEFQRLWFSKCDLNVLLARIRFEESLYFR